jgi:hypothetical protein
MARKGAIPRLPERLGKFELEIRRTPHTHSNCLLLKLKINKDATIEKERRRSDV